MEYCNDEYYCTNHDEKEYLQSKGFKYSFVKNIIDGKKTTCWKYKKSSSLFDALKTYYK